MEQDRRIRRVHGRPALGAVAGIPDDSGAAPMIGHEPGKSVSPVAKVPALCIEYLEPGGHLALEGLSGEQSPLEARNLVVGDITVTGLLSGSSVFAETIAALTAATFDLALLIGVELPLERVADALTPGAVVTTGGPKAHIVVAA